MCGIAGFLNIVKASPEGMLNEMIGTMPHRGPDGRGLWHDATDDIGLAHARLSILDLSSAATQPMVSQSKRYVISYNGEIYNHVGLRAELDGLTDTQWRSNSDTETLVELIEFWGLDVALQKTHGMFAVAVWDTLKKTLSLARDRMGEKPLYYGWVNGAWVFASELKAIKKFPGFNNEIDRKALAQYLRLGSIPSPLSIYKNISKVEPGAIVSLQSAYGSLKIRQYWSTIDTMIAGSQSLFEGSDIEAEIQLENILSNVVSMQMLSDVPLGAFLSGGIDSSLICALMQANSTGRIDTCSIGFESKKFNEAEHARAVAQHLGTNHFDLYVTGKEALDVVPLLPVIYDEPFADASQIPTYLVSKIAKKNVTVALTGDAGDELFGGYNRYTLTDKYWSKLSILPQSLRQLIGTCIQRVPISQLDRILGPLFGSRFNNLGDKIHKGANVMGAANVDQLYMRMLSQVAEPSEWLIGHSDVTTDALVSGGDSVKLSDIEMMMMTDLVGYLPNDILTKVDRAAMAVSLESRVPFLDPDVIKFAASLPLHMKIRNGDNKWILKKILYKYVPKTLLDRPKMGFSVPLDEWLRGPLIDWAEALLESSRLEREGFFNVSTVRQKWEEHKSGSRNWQYQLWNVLMFQLWLEHNK